MPLRPVIHRLGRAYVSKLLREEFRNQTFDRLNERPVEYAFALRQVALRQPRSILDVGTGATSLPHLLRTCGAVVTAIDNVRDFWPSGSFNRHWHVIDDDIRAPRLGGSFDLVTCISVLEHIPEHGRAVSAMLGLLPPGGHAVVTAPHHARRFCPNVYELPGSDAAGRPRPPYATQAFSPSEVDGWLAGVARVADEEYWQFYDGEYWTVGRRLPVPRQVGPGERHQIACLLLERR